MSETLHQLIEAADGPPCRSHRFLRAGYLFSALLSAALLGSCFAVYHKSGVFRDSAAFTGWDILLLGAIAHGAVLSLAVAVIEVRMYSIRSREERRRSLRLKALLKHVTDVQEREREELGEKLHDDIGGCLTAIKLEIENLGTNAETQAKVDRCLKGLDAAIEVTRGLSHALYPQWIGSIGLSGALTDLVERMTSDLLEITVQADDDVDESLGESVGICVYRIVQEAVVNAMRHASGARNVRVLIQRRGRGIIGTVDDDGHGWGSCKVGLGLTLMRERVGFLHGTLCFESSPLGGARLRFEIPQAQEEGVKP